MKGIAVAMRRATESDRRILWSVCCKIPPQPLQWKVSRHRRFASMLARKHRDTIRSRRQGRYGVSVDVGEGVGVGLIHVKERTSLARLAFT
jgi:hypothetical protein